MIFFLIAFGFIVLAFICFMKAAVQFARIKSNERLALDTAKRAATIREAEIRAASAEAERRAGNSGQQLSPETLRALREASEQMNRTTADYISKNMSAKSPAGGIEDEWPDTIGE